MKQYLSSVLVVLLMGAAFTALTYKLNEFNENVAKAMFSVPAQVQTVVVANE